MLVSVEKKMVQVACRSWGSGRRQEGAALGRTFVPLSRAERLARRLPPLSHPALASWERQDWAALAPYLGSHGGQISRDPREKTEGQQGHRAKKW